MGTFLTDQSAQTSRLREQRHSGDSEAPNRLWGLHSARLSRMMGVRLDRRLRAWIAAWNVIQIEGDLASIPGGLDRV